MADPAASQNKQMEAIKNLVDDLAEQHASQDAERERRSAVRYTVEVPISIEVFDDAGQSSGSEKAWAQDISYSGIGILSSKHLAQEENTCVSFSSVVTHLHDIRIRVVHSRKLLDATYKDGASFIFDEDDDT